MRKDVLAKFCLHAIDKNIDPKYRPNKNIDQRPDINFSTESSTNKHT